MNILQVHNFYKEKGGEDTVVDTEKSLLELAGANLYTAYAYNNVQSHQIFRRRRQYYNDLSVLLSKVKFDVAHIHNLYQIIGNDIYSLLASNGIKIVQTLHNYRLLCPNGVLLDNELKICERCKKGMFQNAILKKCYGNSYVQSAYMAWQIQDAGAKAHRYVDTFIAVSSFVKNKYVEFGFPSEKIVVKPNFTPKIEESLTNVGDYALYIGRLSPEKGIETLLKAFSELPYKLKVAGTGPLEQKLKMNYASDNISYNGYVTGEDKNELVRNAAFLVVPSECYETFGMVVKEAHSFNKNVLLSDIGALPELVSNGDRLFIPGNTADLKRKAQAMFTSIKSHASYKLSSQYLSYSQKNAIEDLLRLYN